MAPKRARRVPITKMLLMHAPLAPAHDNGDVQAINVIRTLTLFMFLSLA